MELTDEQKNILLRKLNESWARGRECPICHNSSWGASDVIFELREFVGGGLVLGGDCKVQPIITLTCLSCGNIVLLNALVLGVYTPPKTEVNEGAK